MYSLKKFLISVAFRKNQPSARYIKNFQKDIDAYNVFIKSRSFSFTLYFSCSFKSQDSKCFKISSI